jgi:hypothetical protein
MKTGLKGCLILGFVLTGGAAGRTPVLTIQVSNQAEVDQMPLVQAEETATAIFKKTGVECRWTEPAAGGSFLSHIQLIILPSIMSIRLGLPYKIPDNAMGLAPGSGPDRQTVYVFYSAVKALAMKHVANTHGDAAPILGHAIAHEIGHLLLNAQVHSDTGIMRGEWNLWDLRNAISGYLLFTPQQAKVIREEVSRRFIAPLPESRIAPN